VNILVVGPSWVGDMVMAQILFKGLRQSFPDCEIDVLSPGWSAPIIKRIAEVRQVIDFPFLHGEFAFFKRRAFARNLIGQYDRAVVLPGSWKSALVPFFAKIPIRTGYLGEQRYGLLNDIKPLPKAIKKKTAQKFYALSGQAGDFSYPQLTVDKDNQQKLCNQFDIDLQQAWIALMPGAEFGPSKQWPATHHISLANQLIDDGYSVMLLGSKKDKSIADQIQQGVRQNDKVLNLCGKTQLEDSVDLIALAKVGVANDSGLMHITAALGTPIVAIYGSTTPDVVKPLADKRSICYLGLECSPCYKRECPLGHTNCMNKLDFEFIADEVKRWAND